MVSKLSVETTADVPVKLAVVGDREQVGRLDASEGLTVMAQVRATSPVNPPVGVTDMASVTVGPPATVLPEVAPLRENPGPAATVTATLAVCVILPETPVTVTV